MDTNVDTDSGHTLGQTGRDSRANKGTDRDRE